MKLFSILLGFLTLSTALVGAASVGDGATLNVPGFDDAKTVVFSPRGPSSDVEPTTRGQVLFGASVELASTSSPSSLRLLVGAPLYDFDGSTMTAPSNKNGGAVFLYEFNDASNDWDILWELAGDTNEELGRSITLGKEGSRVAILRNNQNPRPVEVYDISSSGGSTPIGSPIFCQPPNKATTTAATANLVRLSPNGQRLAISCQNGRGKVEIFELVGGVWSMIGQFLVRRNILLVTSRNYDGSTMQDTGAFAVFEYSSGNTWNQLGSDVPGSAADIHLGAAGDISSDGSTVVVTAPEDSNGANLRGSALVYTYDSSSNEWIQRGAPVLGEEGDMLGQSVALSDDGTRFVVSSWLHDGARGQARLLEFDGTNYVDIAQANGLNQGDRLGFGFGGVPGLGRGSVAISADGALVAVGESWTNNDSGYSTGRVYVLDSFLHTQVTDSPTKRPSPLPSSFPSSTPTASPTASPTAVPTASPTAVPTSSPTDVPTNAPSFSPTPSPSDVPTSSPSGIPTSAPSSSPTSTPTTSPTSPTATGSPSPGSTASPTDVPTASPTDVPTSAAPTTSPTAAPSRSPSAVATGSFGSASPTGATESPTETPTETPSQLPSVVPTGMPTTTSPTVTPSGSPSSAPSVPTSTPSHSPTRSPSTVAATGSPSTSTNKLQYDVNLYDFEVKFSESTSEEEIILKYNITRRPFLVQIFQPDCETPVNESFVRVHNATSPDPENPANDILEVSLDLQEANITKSSGIFELVDDDEELAILGVCARVDLQSPTGTLVVFDEQIVFVKLSLTNNFTVTSIDLERIDPSVHVEDVELDYGLTACQCSASNGSPHVCHDQVLGVGDIAEICVELPHNATVDIASVRSFSLTQNATVYSRISNGITDDLTHVQISPKMAVIQSMLISAFFDHDDPANLTAQGSVVLSFDDSGTRRLRHVPIRLLEKQEEESESVAGFDGVALKLANDDPSSSSSPFLTKVSLMVQVVTVGLVYVFLN